jgi:hypothetical protein
VFIAAIQILLKAQYASVQRRCVNFVRAPEPV